jgi:hypothetical protein
MADKNITSDSNKLEETSSEIVEKSTDETSDIQEFNIDKDRRKSIIPASHQPKSSDEHLSDTESTVSEKETKSDFDSFIISYFTPFSGSENIIEWLAETEKKFKELKISRNLRFVAVPLLIEGAAKNKYIHIRNKIKSFDDFYEYLLNTYESSDSSIPQTETIPSSRSQSSTHSVPLSSTHKNISFDLSNKTITSTFDITDDLPGRPILRSTALVDVVPAGTTGDGSESRSVSVPIRSSQIFNSSLDETTYVVRKAIVDNLIKNPKTFQGGKDEVKQWLADLESLFDTAQIPDCFKLDLVPYSLRGEALRWFKINKSTFTSWSSFVQEFKEAFLSPYHEELAFKKLESYTQGMNQPVRSFYNEVLKLCQEADPTMSESTKLKNLLNKVLPRIQFEVRRKKPTTTKQFLEYAKEIEELLQLTNIDPSIDNQEPSQTSHLTSSITRTTTPAPSASSYIPSLIPSNTSNNIHNNDYNSTPNYNSHNMPPSITPNQSSRITPSFTQASRYHSNTQRSNRYHNSDRNPSVYSDNNPKKHNNSNRSQYRVNNINSSEEYLTSDTIPSVPNSEFCSHCKQSGHTASACSRF